MCIYGLSFGVFLRGGRNECHEIGMRDEYMYNIEQWLVAVLLLPIYPHHGKPRSDFMPSTNYMYVINNSTRRLVRFRERGYNELNTSHLSYFIESGFWKLWTESEWNWRIGAFWFGWHDVVLHKFTWRGTWQFGMLYDNTMNENNHPCSFVLFIVTIVFVFVFFFFLFFLD